MTAHGLHKISAKITRNRQIDIRFDKGNRQRLECLRSRIYICINLFFLCMDRSKTFDITERNFLYGI